MVFPLKFLPHSACSHAPIRSRYSPFFFHLLSISPITTAICADIFYEINFIVISHHFCFSIPKFCLCIAIMPLFCGYTSFIRCFVPVFNSNIIWNSTSYSAVLPVLISCSTNTPLFLYNIEKFILFSLDNSVILCRDKRYEMVYDTKRRTEAKG